ncbi:MAG: N-acetyltransferase [Gemmatimonadetes bacterium]|nr:N-acetyltransferase [Gemmatimonadota bacterium]
MADETRHDPGRRRFLIDTEGGEAHLDYVDAGDRTLDYRHTFVPEALRGREIGARLVKDALDWARENGYRVIPSCPFVRRIVDRNPEYRDLVSEGK